MPTERAEELAEDRPVEPHDLIVRFCKLQCRVMRAVFGYMSANDCFCGERQDWVERGLWRNEMTALEWIEKVVDEAIAEMGESNG